MASWKVRMIWSSRYAPQVVFLSILLVIMLLFRLRDCQISGKSCMTPANCVSVQASRSFSSSAAVVAPVPDGSGEGSGQSDFFLFLLQGLPSPSRSDKAVFSCFL